MPKVSVLILSYNQLLYINHAINSVLIQGYGDFEIVIGDDASTDGTVEILKGYKERLGEKLKLILNKKNVGITENMNACLRACKGQYIFLLGGDDLFLEGKIAAQVEHLENNPNVFISYHDVNVFQSETNKILYRFNEKHKGFSGGVDLLIRNGTFCCGCSVAVRNVNLPFCNPLIRYSSDWLWMVDLMKNNPGGVIEKIDGVYASYRRHDKNITNYLSVDVERGLSEVMKSLDLIQEHYPEEAANVKVARAERVFAFALKAMVQFQFFLAFALLGKSLRLNLIAPVLFLKRRMHLGV